MIYVKQQQQQNKDIKYTPDQLLKKRYFFFNFFTFMRHQKVKLQTIKKAAKVDV